MKTLKSVTLASTIAFGLVVAETNSTFAGTLASLAASAPAPVASSQSAAQEVRHRSYGSRFSRRHVRPHYSRRDHGPRFRRPQGRYRHYHDGFWYSFPWWVLPFFAAPSYGDQCQQWSNRCYRNWGGGANYRGCMRYHGCM